MEAGDAHVHFLGEFFDLERPVVVSHKRRDSVHDAAGLAGREQLSALSVQGNGLKRSGEGGAENLFGRGTVLTKGPWFLRLAGKS